MIPENEVIPLKKWFAAVLLAALVLTGCGPKQPEAHEAQLFAMDTLMSLRIWGDEALVTQTEDTLRSLEALLSATAEELLSLAEPLDRALENSAVCVVGGQNQLASCGLDRILTI